MKSMKVDNGATAWLRMWRNSVTILFLSLSSIVDTASGDCTCKRECKSDGRERENNKFSLEL
jgi:hypothetical protein